MKREKYPPRKIRLCSEVQRQTALRIIESAPLDEATPLEFLLREEVKARKPDQNSAMWAGPLKDIQDQAWLNGRQYSAEVWHEYFKAEFLPEEYDPELCKEGYEKWQIGVKGERLLIGSTKSLTVKGFHEHMEKVHAFGADLEVKFHANPNDRRYGL